MWGGGWVGGRGRVGGGVGGGRGVGGGVGGVGGYWVWLGGKQPFTSTNAERTLDGSHLLHHKSDMMVVECSSKISALQFSSNTKATPCCAVEQKDADTHIPSQTVHQTLQFRFNVLTSGINLFSASKTVSYAPYFLRKIGSGLKVVKSEFEWRFNRKVIVIILQR